MPKTAEPPPLRIETPSPRGPFVYGLVDPLAPKPKMEAEITALRAQIEKGE